MTADIIPLKPATMLRNAKTGMWLSLEVSRSGAATFAGYTLEQVAESSFATLGIEVSRDIAVLEKTMARIRAAVRPLGVRTVSFEVRIRWAPARKETYVAYVKWTFETPSAPGRRFYVHFSGY